LLGHQGPSITAVEICAVEARAGPTDAMVRAERPEDRAKNTQKSATRCRLGPATSAAGTASASTMGHQGRRRRDFMYRDIPQWQQIRHRIDREGAPKRQVSRETGISRRTINKMLAHERPPAYGPRPAHYPKLEPYIPVIDRLLEQAVSPTGTAEMTITDIFEQLRLSEGFAGSYDSVRNYIRRRARDDVSAWEQAHELIVRLPKARALDFIRLLSQGEAPVLASGHLRSFVREAGHPCAPPTRPTRERQRRADSEWMRQVVQKEVGDDILRREFEDLPNFHVLVKHLRGGCITARNRAMVALASHRKIPGATIRAFLGVGKAFVRKYRDKFEHGDVEAMFAPQTRSNRKIDNETLRNAVFCLLHEPPANHGINRTTWTMPILCQVLRENGNQIGPAVVRKMIKVAGYKWRRAKVVLTSNDPTYLEKLAGIRSILSNLQPDEAFFSIDEYGPFAIKAKAGRKLVPPGVQPVVPQWQRSRGCMIMTAALDLSGNQVTHFYSAKKNTGEMIRMMDVLIERYAERRKLYLSWDAASWHISKRLFARIDAHNAAVADGSGPLIATAPLPAGAQFLNVIESVFSGMARAIIHNSDYKSVDDAKAAIDEYFAGRNAHFRDHPRRAGKKLWGKEREPAVFSEGNNCKDPRYR
jgi:transposase